jgi:hypothetical protein
LQLAGETTDSVLRQDLTVKLYRRWAKADGTAAAAWLQAAQLTPELKAKLANAR